MFRIWSFILAEVSKWSMSQWVSGKWSVGRLTNQTLNSIFTIYLQMYHFFTS